MGGCAGNFPKDGIEDILHRAGEFGISGGISLIQEKFEVCLSTDIPGSESDTCHWELNKVTVQKVRLTPE